MKKLLITGLGVAGACAACCAMPLVVPIISGLSVAALAVPGGLVFATEFSGVATLVGIAAGVAACGALWWARRRRTARACASGPQATQLRWRMPPVAVKVRAKAPRALPELATAPSPIQETLP